MSHPDRRMKREKKRATRELLITLKQEIYNRKLSGIKDPTLNLAYEKIKEGLKNGQNKSPGGHQGTH